MGQTQMRISDEIEKVKSRNHASSRVSYEYDMRIAKIAWHKLAHSNAKDTQVKYSDFKPSTKQAEVWTELIKYVFADQSCRYDINNSIALIGGTGTGKTMTMHTMLDFIGLDKIKRRKGANYIPMKYCIVSAKQTAQSVIKNGSGAIMMHCTVPNLCIDDLGAESQTVKHYGSSMNVIEEIIETRYHHNLVTHFTSNLNEQEILEMYDSRVHSRIFGTTNIIPLVGDDYRII